MGTPAITSTIPPHRRLWQHHLVTTMRLVVIALSIVMVAMISFDTLQNISFIADRTYLRVQFYICIVFILDVIVEWIFSDKKEHYIATHIFFLLISIPYLNIVSRYHVQLPPEVMYLMRFIPMLRAAYVLGIVTGVTAANWISSMFATYMIVLIMVVYFGSLMFFVEEHYINPDVTSYWASLWWTMMNLTTVGCYIEPVTPTGKALSVILSGGGLILFPVFTVYLTNVLKDDAPDAVAR